MEEIDGEEVVDKYVTKVKEKPREIAHVGGPFPKKDTIEKLYEDLDKKAINKSRDY